MNFRSKEIISSFIVFLCYYIRSRMGLHLAALLVTSTFSVSNFNICSDGWIFQITTFPYAQLVFWLIILFPFLFAHFLPTQNLMVTWRRSWGSMRREKEATNLTQNAMAPNGTPRRRCFPKEVLPEAGASKCWS